MGQGSASHRANLQTRKTLFLAAIEGFLQSLRLRCLIVFVAGEQAGEYRRGRPWLPGFRGGGGLGFRRVYRVLGFRVLNLGFGV